MRAEMKSITEVTELQELADTMAEESARIYWLEVEVDLPIMTPTALLLVDYAHNGPYYRIDLRKEIGPQDIRALLEKAPQHWFTNRTIKIDAAALSDYLGVDVSNRFINSF